MRLDQTGITIRERGYAEILDLAMRVTWTHGGAILAALAAGAAPFAALNAWLLWDLRLSDFNVGIPLSYMLCLVGLTTLQRPLATSFLTVYLGKVMFHQRPSWRDVLADVKSSLGRLLLLQGLLRPLTLLRPFSNHVLLLERNPVLSRDPAVPSFRKRVKRLHADNGNEVSRAILMETPLCWGLVAVCMACLASNIAILANEFHWSRDYCTIAFPAILWAVVGYFEVARFLEYIDIRIRREGWEVELLIRAERDRLLRRFP